MIALPVTVSHFRSIAPGLVDVVSVAGIVEVQVIAADSVCTHLARKSTIRHVLRLQRPAAAVDQPFAAGRAPFQRINRALAVGIAPHIGTLTAIAQMVNPYIYATSDRYCSHRQSDD